MTFENLEYEEVPAQTVVIDEERLGGTEFTVSNVNKTGYLRVNTIS